MERWQAIIGPCEDDRFRSDGKLIIGPCQITGMALGRQKKYKCDSRMRALYHSVEQADRQEKHKCVSRMRTLYHPVDIRSDTRGDDCEHIGAGQDYRGA